MSEAAAIYDEDLDLSPEVLCSLLRRRSMTPTSHEREQESEERAVGLFRPSAPDRLNPIWV